MRHHLTIFVLFFLVKTHAISGDDLYNELLDFLFEEASSLSHYEMYPASHRPQILKRTQDQIRQEVCPDDPNNCYNLAAFYNTEKNQIVYDEVLDIDNNHDNSFIVHEIVHSLQFFHKGTDIFKDCESTKITEQEAYDVQNIYLKKMGQFGHYGEALKFLICDNDELNNYKLNTKIKIKLTTQSQI